MNIKFCGIRRKEDVEFCNTLLPEYMGMILSQGFKRTISAELAAELVRQKNAAIKAVGIFVNEAPKQIADIAKETLIDIIQLHGDETAETVFEIKRLIGLPIWKAVRVRNEQDIRSAEKLGVDRLILEGFAPGKIGGEGMKADWELLSAAKPQIPFFLAGGITPENIREGIASVKPDGVDISGGIETNGIKDFNKMRKIANIIRGE